MVVVEQLSSELKVKLAAELVETFDDVLGLLLEICIVVKTDFAHVREFLKSDKNNCFCKYDNWILLFFY